MSSSKPSARSTTSMDQVFDQVQQNLADEQASRAQWSKTRTRAYKIVHTPWFDMSMSSLVLLNMVFVVLEVNRAAKQETWMFPTRGLLGGLTQRGGGGAESHGRKRICTETLGFGTGVC